MDQVFKNTLWGDIIIKESDPQWVKDQWLRLLGIAPPAFAPTFRVAFGSDGTSVWSLNSDYFPSKPTAQHIADKYGDGTVTEVPFQGSGGIFTASENEYHIKLKDGRMVNAGILAAYYVRNPESQFPGLADKLIQAVLAK